LAGESFADRLRRWTGEHTIADRRHALQAGGYTPDQEAAKLAEEAMQSPELLRSEWEWLASDRAQYVYAFARRLGELDVNYQWWPEIEPLAHSGKGSTFASAYLQGQAGAGRREWRDRVLDAWVEEGLETAPAVLDAVWRGGLNDADAQRLVTLVDQGWLRGGQLGWLVWGAATRELSAEAFFELIQAILNEDSDGATASALDLLHQRIGSFEGEKDSLAALVWTVLERRGTGREGITALFHRSDLAGRYVSDAPVRVARAMLDLFKREGVHFSQEDSAIQVLAKATDLRPQEVWEEVAPRLLARENDSLSLYMCLRGWYGQRVGAKVLLPWAREHQPEGPSLVAALTPVDGEPLDELPRQLLIEFGKDKAVASALHTNLIAGTFTGPTSSWYGAKLETATKWLSDPHLAVRKWAAGVVNELESQLGNLTRMEAEARF
jgi:hypothetical protein